MTLDELLALLPDNTIGDIGADDLRTIVTDLYTAAHGVDYVSRVHQGPFTLPSSSTFVPLPAPGPVAGTITLTDDRVMLVVLSANIDTMSTNNQVEMGINFGGATDIPVGNNPEQVLWCGGKQPVQSTLEVTFVQVFSAGITDLDVRYKAQANGAEVTALAIFAVVLG